MERISPEPPHVEPYHNHLHDLRSFMGIIAARLLDLSGNQAGPAETEDKLKQIARQIREKL